MSSDPCDICDREECIRRLGDDCDRNRVDWRARALAAERESARLIGEAGMWSCPECAFTYAAYHVNADGTYTCPLCELATAQHENAGLLGTNHGQARSEAFFRDRCEQLEAWAADTASENFGPFPVQSVEENIAAIGRGIGELHRDFVNQRTELERIQSTIAALTRSHGGGG